jgi:pyruvate/2-oxoglutarate dehydrogenase complex dihydrolipoamide dehydrogenase (E3) component
LLPDFAPLPKEMGCKINEQGHIEVNLFQKTSVEGIFACGDNSGIMRSIAKAVYAGNITGAIVNMELALEEF